jgi:hypothetical protein
MLLKTDGPVYQNGRPGVVAGKGAVRESRPGASDGWFGSTGDGETYMNTLARLAASVFGMVALIPVAAGGQAKGAEGRGARHLRVRLSFGLFTRRPIAEIARQDPSGEVRRRH